MENNKIHLIKAQHIQSEKDILREILELLAFPTHRINGLSKGGAITVMEHLKDKLREIFYQ